MNQLRKDLRDAYNRHAMAEHELKTQLHSFHKAIRELGKELRKKHVPYGSWLKTQKAVHVDGAAGLGMNCSFSSTHPDTIALITKELTDRGWIVYDTVFVPKDPADICSCDHTMIKAY